MEEKNKQNEQLDDLNDLVNELKTTKSLAGLMIPPKSIVTIPEKIDENNIDDFIFRKSSTLIQQGVDVIENLKGALVSGGKAEEIEAYSKLMSSVANSIEILNKINLQKRKEKAAKELKQMDLDASNKLLDKYDTNTTIKNQTNIIVATREEIMKALVDKAGTLVEEAEVIDIKEE
ncbi:MAG: hypothetical protein PHS54_00080 [Clostridia bacterium]|nr:hypothetical protein [Clostridia bacterium]